MPRGAQNLAAVFFNGHSRAVLQSATEGVVNSDEVPGLAELRQGLADGSTQLIGIVNPVHQIIGRARLAGEIGRACAGQQDGLVGGFGDLERGERNARVDEIGNRIDAFEIEPASRNARADVGLVLVIGRNDLNRHAVYLVIELFRGDLGGFDRAHAGASLIGSGKIGEDADLDLAARHLGVGGGNEKQERSGGAAGGEAHVFPPKACREYPRSPARSRHEYRPVWVSRVKVTIAETGAMRAKRAESWPRPDDISAGARIEPP